MGERDIKFWDATTDGMRGRYSDGKLTAAEARLDLGFILQREWRLWAAKAEKAGLSRPEAHAMFVRVFTAVFHSPDFLEVDRVADGRMSVDMQRMTGRVLGAEWCDLPVPTELPASVYYGVDRGAPLPEPDPEAVLQSLGIEAGWLKDGTHRFVSSKEPVLTRKPEASDIFLQVVGPVFVRDAAGNEAVRLDDGTYALLPRTAYLQVEQVNQDAPPEPDPEAVLQSLGIAEP